MKKTATDRRTASMTVRTDPETKKQASEIFEELGLDMSTAVNIFLKQAIRYNGIPFEVRAEIPNKRTLKAIEGAENGSDLHGPFDSVEEMMEALNA